MKLKSGLNQPAFLYLLEGKISVTFSLAIPSANLHYCTH